MLETYQPSGRVGFLLPAVALAAVIPVVLLAWLYQTLLWWIPLVYLEWLVAVGMAIGLMVGIEVVCKLGQCRNVLAGALVGVMLGGVALLSTHYFDYRNHRSQFVEEFMKEANEKHAKTFADMNVGTLDEDGKPAEITPENIRRLYTLGVHYDVRVETGWRIGFHGVGFSLSSYFVYIVWLIEAAGFLVAGFLGGRLAARHPFDEAANDWMTQKKIWSGASSDAEGRRLAGAGSIEQLLQLPGKVKFSGVVIEYHLALASDAKEPSYLSIKQVTTAKDKDDKESTSTKSLVDWVKITPESTKQLKKMMGA